MELFLLYVAISQKKIGRIYTAIRAKKNPFLKK
jgi:hypothetical protein